MGAGPYLRGGSEGQLLQLALLESVLGAAILK